MLCFSHPAAQFTLLHAKNILYKHSKLHPVNVNQSHASPNLYAIFKINLTLKRCWVDAGAFWRLPIEKNNLSFVIVFPS